MRIKKIVSQDRRDFTAIYKCEHCGFTYIAVIISITFKGNGYDDSYSHYGVIPQMKCPRCKNTAGEDYRPLSTKYPDDVQV